MIAKNSILYCLCVLLLFSCKTSDPDSNKPKDESTKKTDHKADQKNNVSLLTKLNQRVSPRGQITYDEGTNTLIITDIRPKIEEMIEIINILDRPQTAAEQKERNEVQFALDRNNDLETAIVKLQYLTPQSPFVAQMNSTFFDERVDFPRPNMDRLFISV